MWCCGGGWIKYWPGTCRWSFLSPFSPVHNCSSQIQLQLVLSLSPSLIFPLNIPQYVLCLSTVHLKCPIINSIQSSSSLCSVPMSPIRSCTQLKATTPFSCSVLQGESFLWLTRLGGFYIQVQPNLPKCRCSLSGNLFLQSFQLLSAVDVWSWADLNSIVHLLHVIFHFTDHYYHYYCGSFGFILQAEVLVYSISLCTEIILLVATVHFLVCLSSSWDRMKAYGQWNLALFK